MVGLDVGINVGLAVCGLGVGINVGLAVGGLVVGIKVGLEGQVTSSCCPCWQAS